MLILRKRSRALCQCGCGTALTPIPKGAKTAKRLWGTYRRFVSGHGGGAAGRPFDDCLDADTKPGCLLWTRAVGTHGYGVLTIGGALKSAHVYAYERVRGPVPEGFIVLHSCDTRLCCNIDHLRAGSHSENILEAYARGGRDIDKQRHTLRKALDAHYPDRLTDADKLRIAAHYHEGRVTYRELAKQYGVAHTTIARVVCDTTNAPTDEICAKDE